MNNVIEHFCSAFDIENMSSKRDEHHDLTGSKSQRITENVEKLFSMLIIPTLRSLNVSTILQDSKFADPFLAPEDGAKLLQKYATERLEGNKLIWDTMTKRKLLTFVSNVKSVTIKVKDQLVNAREEHKLISRFSIACITRHSIDLPHYLGEYEYSVLTPYPLQMDICTLPETKQKQLARLRN